jgi:hypothetical protein
MAKDDSMPKIFIGQEPKNTEVTVPCTSPVNSDSSQAAIEIDNEVMFVRATGYKMMTTSLNPNYVGVRRIRPR